MPNLKEYIEATQACETPSELFNQFDQFISPYSFDITTYVMIAVGLRAIPVEVGTIYQTFPPEWAKYYVEHSYGDVDPFIQQVQREAKPFRWFDVETKMNLNAKQKKFLSVARKSGITDGLAVPVFGPKGTIAYFGLGCIGGTLNLTDSEMLELQCACLQTHNRYLDLCEPIEEPPAKPLSPRETEVLSLVAQGQSNSRVAKELSITENTVDTLLRRVFAKLNVNNRISAVLRGIGSGAILP